MATVSSVNTDLGFDQNSGWYAQTSGTNMVPGNMVAGGVYGGLLGNPGIPGACSEEAIDGKISEALKTRVHINVAKDQEDRICELEKVVGELIAYNKQLQEKKHEELLKLEIERQREDVGVTTAMFMNHPIEATQGMLKSLGKPKAKYSA